MDPYPDRELWTIDTERSTLTFSLRHALFRQIRGEFRSWGGQVLVDQDDPSAPSIRVWVDMSSLDTGSEKRNDYILNTELFDIGWEPALVFDSDRFEVNESGHPVVVGWLSLHSYRRQIAVSVGAALPRDFGLSAPRVATTVRASIKRGMFGLRRKSRPRDWLNDRLVGETIQITAHVEAVREPRRHAPRPDAATIWTPSFGRAGGAAQRIDGEISSMA
jgi:polyisoprenoid-binding protein YceI